MRAQLAAPSEDWRWSSVAAHYAGKDDAVVSVAPALERVGDFRRFLAESFDEAESYAALRRAETVGRPVGSAVWLTDMGERLGRTLGSGDGQ